MKRAFLLPRASLMKMSEASWSGMGGSTAMLLSAMGCDLNGSVQHIVKKHLQITRWEHEDVMERTEARLKDNPDMMKIRRAAVEYPFGTLKGWMGSTHFLTKTLGQIEAPTGRYFFVLSVLRVCENRKQEATNLLPSG